MKEVKVARWEKGTKCGERESSGRKIKGLSLLLATTSLKDLTSYFRETIFGW